MGRSWGAKAEMAVVRPLLRAWLVLCLALNGLSGAVWAAFDSASPRELSDLVAFVAAAGLQLPIVLMFAIPHIVCAAWWSGLGRGAAGGGGKGGGGVRPRGMAWGWGGRARRGDKPVAEGGAMERGTAGAGPRGRNGITAAGAPNTSYAT